MNIRIVDLESLPHKVLTLMAEDQDMGPWYIKVWHGMHHMESKYEGYLVAQDGHEITLDRCNPQTGERIGVKVVLHEDWIQEVVVP